MREFVTLKSQRFNDYWDLALKKYGRNLEIQRLEFTHWTVSRSRSAGRNTLCSRLTEEFQKRVQGRYLSPKNITSIFASSWGKTGSIDSRPIWMSNWRELSKGKPSSLLTLNSTVKSWRMSTTKTTSKLTYTNFGTKNWNRSLIRRKWNMSISLMRLQVMSLPNRMGTMMMERNLKSTLRTFLTQIAWTLPSLYTKGFCQSWERGRQKRLRVKNRSVRILGLKFRFNSTDNRGTWLLLALLTRFITGPVHSPSIEVFAFGHLNQENGLPSLSQIKHESF